METKGESKDGMRQWVVPFRRVAAVEEIAARVRTEWLLEAFEHEIAASAFVPNSGLGSIVEGQGFERGVLLLADGGWKNVKGPFFVQEIDRHRFTV